MFKKKSSYFTGTVNLATFLNSVKVGIKKHEMTTGSGNDILKISLLLNQIYLSFKKNTGSALGELT
jgi:hypothetical protein